MTATQKNYLHTPPVNNDIKLLVNSAELHGELMPNGQIWPRISIVTPSFNQGQFLEETILSVLNQGYPNLEYIVIDGGSTDNSVEIIQRYQDQLTYWISEPDSGQSHALNKGFSVATGDWLAWLNSDDIYLPGSLLEVAHAIKTNKGCNWVVGAVDFADVKLNSFAAFAPICHTDNWLDFICTKRKTGVILPQMGSFWSRQAWDVSGHLDETLHYAMDYEYWGRLAYNGFRPILLQIKLAKFRLQPQAKTAQGEGVFCVEEQTVIDNWAVRVPEADARILRNYRRTLKLRFLLPRIQRQVNSLLPPLRDIARRYLKDLKERLLNSCEK